MAKKALVFLAEGFEEVEAITPIDYLRRAGIEVTAAGIGVDGEALKKAGPVTGSHGIAVVCDIGLGGLAEAGKLAAGLWDAVICPGGMPGAANIASSKEAGIFIKEMAASGKLAAAICASPALVFFPLGLLNGRAYTCFPGMEEQVPARSGAKWSGERVVLDGAILTSRSAGSAGEFAQAIIGALLGEKEGKSLADKVLLKQ